MPGPLSRLEDLEPAAGRIPIAIEEDLAAARMLQQIRRQLGRHQGAAAGRLLVEAEILRHGRSPPVARRPLRWNRPG